MKKIIGFILLILLIFVVAELLLPISFVRAPRLKNLTYEYVMKDAFKEKDPLVTDIAMLGAHDAFSSGIGFTSKVDPNETGIVTNKIVGIVAKGFVVKLSKAQNADAKELLYGGVRYLDVRVTKTDDGYYTSHGYLSNKFEVYLKDVVEFLETHPGELVLFDIQYFRSVKGEKNSTKEEYEKLFDMIKTVKGKEGKNLFDFVNYDSSEDKLEDLRYTKATNNRSEAGVIILMKEDSFSEAYYRDRDASYKRNYYESIRSLWHEENSTKAMLDGIKEEYEYLKENPTSGIFVVNQAQKTGFLSNAKLLRSLYLWSLLDMASGFNALLVKDEKQFKDWLSVMPIFMVDNSLSTKGNFNKLANKYILEYNQSL